MLIKVALLKGYSEPLTYAIPNSWDTKNLVGSIVRVPFRTYEAPALVTHLLDESENTYPYKIREALAQEPLPHDPHYRRFVTQLARYYRIDELFFIKRLRLMLDEHAEPVEILPSALETIQPTLTPEQQKIVDAIAPTIGSSTYSPNVIYGVTGSGKTEIYKQLIITTHGLNKTTFFLLPEISLALRFEELLRTTLPADIPVLSFHAGTSQKNRYRVWQLLHQQQPFVLVGVHLPITLPCANLGLIIVDEEHETGYQEKNHPKIHTKEAAIMRAAQYTITLVLGSATPSFSSLYNVRTKNWRLFELTKRFAGAFPTLSHVLLTDKRQRRSFWISTILETAIRDRLLKREQVILFLNRRGFSLFVQCKACSFTFMCRNCSVSLTLHGTNQLTCHYCGLHKTLPDTCPHCSAGADQLMKKGIGTQQVVTILEKLFPMARVGRADLDASSKKKQWRETLTKFEQGEIDIMVGTQTITKGFHFSRVTLVGIVWADLSLNFPIYNATETALQQMVQVAGRAGRETEHGQVIVQSMVNHPVFAYTREEKYLDFYEYEMALRQAAGYPPYARLAEIEIKHAREATVEKDAYSFVQKLMSQKRALGCNVQVLGPAKPLVHMVQRMHTRKIYLKSQSFNDMHRLLDSITMSTYTSAILFTPNPQS